MALGAVLVDRARVVDKVGTTKVQGRTQFNPVLGTWFKARLFLPASEERADAQGRRRKVIKKPTLLCGVKDTAGGVVLVQADQMLEVASPDLGSAVWQIEGDPEPLRKKRKVIGFQATLKRITEHEFVTVP